MRRDLRFVAVIDDFVGIAQVASPALQTHAVQSKLSQFPPFNTIPLPLGLLAHPQNSPVIKLPPEKTLRPRMILLHLLPIIMPHRPPRPPMLDLRAEAHFEEALVAGDDGAVDGVGWRGRARGVAPGGLGLVAHEVVDVAGPVAKAEAVGGAVDTMVSVEMASYRAFLMR